MPKSDVFIKGDDGTVEEVIFFCPGCKCCHLVRVNHPEKQPNWEWNGSLNSPTFQPSILSNSGHPSQCHSFVTDGSIQFLGDCHHELAGKTVELPDYHEIYGLRA